MRGSEEKDFAGLTPDDSGERLVDDLAPIKDTHKHDARGNPEVPADFSQGASFSVIVCCFDSADRIAPTLEAIAEQKNLRAFPWELVLVDNGCRDNTVSRGREAWHSKNAPAPLRVVVEPRPGLVFARERGILESRGKYAVFCDDDNRLAQDYLENAAAILERDPRLAAAGGRGEAVSHVSIPSWFQEVSKRYACNQAGQEGSVETLSGAGLVVRRAILERMYSNGFKSLLSGRSGTTLSSGEDTELCHAFRISGWRLCFSPSLRYRHYMPPERLSETYLLEMCRGQGKARPISREYKKLSRSRLRWFYLLPGMWRLYAIEILWRALKTRCRKRRKQDEGGGLERRIEEAHASGMRDFYTELLRTRNWAKLSLQLTENVRALRKMRRGF